MKYACNTSDGIASGEFCSLWPNTSCSDEGAFAISEGYSFVIESRPCISETQTIEACPIYLENGIYYSVRVVSLPLAAVVDALTNMVQARLDAFAQTKGYDSILSAITYANSSNAQFAHDGKTALDARDSMWAACYAMINDMQSGTIPTPEQFTAKLPVIGWAV